MNKLTKIAIIATIACAILIVGFFLFKREFMVVVDTTEYVVDTTVTDTVIGNEVNVIDTNEVYELDTYEYTMSSVYYVVVGSFEYEMNALRYLDSIDNSSIIYNDVYYMVYMYKTDDLKEATNIRVSNKDSYDGVWIYESIE